LADERIFDIPEDDYGSLDNSDDDEQKNLPFHPVPSSPISNATHTQCMLHEFEHNCNAYVCAMRALVYLQ